ncbi:hypothetical protein CRENBAI_019564 [Crenichthys baileyi]|uniref:Uncharacterized protein n=1 Tax=Crenichthys baileyi TaxID=28760 RepID=A0AAV9SNT5_9TELE
MKPDGGDGVEEGRSSAGEQGDPWLEVIKSEALKGDLKSKPQSSCNFLALALGDFKSKLQSSCNSQPWLQVLALHPAKVKFPSSQGIYLDQVLADSSKPLSSSKRTLLTQPTIHHQLQRFSLGNQIHRIKSSRSHQKPYLKKLTTTLDYHRLSSSLTALPDSTSLPHQTHLHPQ